jgi:hypothetical protein
MECTGATAAAEPVFKSNSLGGPKRIVSGSSQTMVPIFPDVISSTLAAAKALAAKEKESFILNQPWDSFRGSKVWLFLDEHDGIGEIDMND